MGEQSKRLGYLDSLRGIAASIVVLHHCYLIYSTDSAPLVFDTAFHSLRNFLFYCLGKMLAGRSAVMLFFVLSGFVLAYSLLKKPGSYSDYAIRRIFRIYPAFVVAILFSYALHTVIGVRHPGNSESLRNDIIPADLSLLVLAKHLLMWGTAESKQLDNVVWSLVHEMRISLLFSLILISVLRLRALSVLLWGLVSLACSGLLVLTTAQYAKGHSEPTVAASFLATGFFIVFFAAGAWLAVQGQELPHWGARLSAWHVSVATAGMIVILLYPSPTSNSFKSNIVDYLHGFGSFGVLALVLAWPPFANALDNSVLNWLGRISYSLYLVHVPVIYAVTQLSNGAWSFVSTTLVVFGVSLVSAELLARFVEYPSIGLGKYFGKRLLSKRRLPQGGFPTAAERKT